MKQLFFPIQYEVELMHLKVIQETGGSYGLRDVAKEIIAGRTSSKTEELR